MATKNLVPRATGEGQLGTTDKKWNHVFAVQGNFNQLKSSNGTSDLFVSENANTLTITHDATTNQYKFNALGGGGASTSGISQYRLVVADGSDALSAADWEINASHHLLPITNNVSNLGAANKKIANVYATIGTIDTVDTDAIKFDDSDSDEYFKIVINGTTNKLQVKRYDDSDVLQSTEDLAYSSDAVSLGTSELNAMEDVTYPNALASDEFLISRDVGDGVIKFENKNANSARTTLGLATNSNVEFNTLKLTGNDAGNNNLGLDVVKPASFGDYSGNNAVIIDTGREIYGKIANNSNIALTIGNNANHKTKIQGELSLEKIRLNDNSALSILKYSNTAINQYVDLDGMKIQDIALPTANGDAANKQYVDSVASGLSLIASVKAATIAPFSTTAALGNGTITLANGEGGFNSTNNTFTVDDISLSQDDRVLIKDKTTHNGSVSFISNGVYTVGALDQATLTLTRATDFTAAALTSGASGAFVFVSQGTINKGSGFVCHSLSTADTVGTHDLLFTGFSSAGDFAGGNGITIDGTTIKTSLAGGTGITITDGPSPSIAVNGVLEDLDTLGAPASDGQFIVATGNGAFAYESGGTVRSSLDLGTSSDVTFNSLAAYDGGVSSEAFNIASLNDNNNKVTLKTANDLPSSYTLILPSAGPTSDNQVLARSNAQGNTYTLSWQDPGLPTYTANGSSNYLQAATSLQDADNKLDAQIKANADDIGTNTTNISTNATNISGKQDKSGILDSIVAAANPSENQILIGNNSQGYTLVNAGDETTRDKFGLGVASTRGVYDGNAEAVANQLIAVIGDEGETKKLPVIDGSNLTGVTAAADLVLDTTPQLGGDLDLNEKVLFSGQDHIKNINLNVESINLGSIKTGQNETNFNKFDSSKSSIADLDNLFSKTGLSEGSILTSIVRLSDDLNISVIKINRDDHRSYVNGLFNLTIQQPHGLSMGDIVYLGNLTINNHKFDGLWVVHQVLGSAKIDITPYNQSSSSNRNNRVAPNNNNDYKYNTLPRELFNIVRNDIRNTTTNAIIPSSTITFQTSSDTTQTKGGVTYNIKTKNIFLVKVSISFIKTQNETELIPGSNPENYLLKRKTFVHEGSNFGLNEFIQDNPSFIVASQRINRPNSEFFDFRSTLKDSSSIEIKQGMAELKDDPTPELSGDLDLLDQKIVSSTSDMTLQNSNNKIVMNSINSTDNAAIGITAQAGGISITAGANKDISITTQGTGELKVNSAEITNVNTSNNISANIISGEYIITNRVNNSPWTGNPYNADSTNLGKINIFTHSKDTYLHLPQVSGLKDGSFIGLGKTQAGRYLRVRPHPNDITNGVRINNLGTTGFYSLKASSSLASDVRCFWDSNSNKWWLI